MKGHGVKDGLNHAAKLAFEDKEEKWQEQIYEKAECEIMLGSQM